MHSIRGLFARRLEELFRTVPGPNGRAYSAKAIAARSTERGIPSRRVVSESAAIGGKRSPPRRSEPSRESRPHSVSTCITSSRIGPRSALATRSISCGCRRTPTFSWRHSVWRGLSSDSVTVVNELIKVLREQQGLPKDPPDVIAAGLSDEKPSADSRLRVVGDSGED